MQSTIQIPRIESSSNDIAPQSSPKSNATADFLALLDRAFEPAPEPAKLATGNENLRSDKAEKADKAEKSKENEKNPLELVLRTIQGLKEKSESGKTAKHDASVEAPKKDLPKKELPKEKEIPVKVPDAEMIKLAVNPAAAGGVIPGGLAEKMAKQNAHPRVQGESARVATGTRAAEPDAKPATQQNAGLKLGSKNETLTANRNFGGLFEKQELPASSVQDAIKFLNDFTKKNVKIEGKEAPATKDASVHAKSDPAALLLRSGESAKQVKVDAVKSDKKAVAETQKAEVQTKSRLEVIDLGKKSDTPSLVLDQLLGEKDALNKGAAAKIANGSASLNAALKETSLSSAAEHKTAPKGTQIVDGTAQASSFLSPTVQTALPVAVIPVHLVSKDGSYQQAFKDWMRASGSQEMVQQAKIMLNKNNNGKINLVLHPEQLGNVTIDLSLKDGRIDGTILVENKEVQAAFQDQLKSLIDDFRNSGFETGTINVTVNDASNRSTASTDDNVHLGRALEKLNAQLGSVQGQYGNSNRVDLVI